MRVVCAQDEKERRQGNEMTEIEKARAVHLQTSISVVLPCRVVSIEYYDLTEMVVG